VVDVAALSPAAASGRVFRAQRRIRLSDTGADGHLRFDAAARYLQDVASDDVDDTGLEDSVHVWVVRRAIIDVTQPFSTDRSVELATWGSGLGRSWASRRSSITGDAGGRIEAEVTWAYVDSRNMRLERLPAWMIDIYGESSAGRQASTKLTLPREPSADARSTPWPLRVSDIDVLAHLNNAVYWAALETALAEHAPGLLRIRGIVEYRQAIDLAQGLELRTESTDTGLLVWFVADGVSAATAEIRALDAGA
jgi:acyl-ACP thioesterase